MRKTPRTDILNGLFRHTFIEDGQIKCFSNLKEKKILKGELNHDSPETTAMVKKNCRQFHHKKVGIPAKKYFSNPVVQGVWKRLIQKLNNQNISYD